MSGADPVAAIEACLGRIAALNPSINAFLSVDADGARNAARAASERWRRGAPLSAVDGMPIGIKANIAVAGMGWHAGIGAYRDRVAARDAGCVARLRAGGAVLLGMLNMDEAALAASTDNPVFGRTENPWRPGYSAGGSSGGAGAAVAAGFCMAALGTDTLGSVRIPAAYCGVVGCKPRHGALGLDGVVALAPQFDTVGVLAVDVAMACRVLAAMGTESGDSRPIGTLGLLAAPDTKIAPAVSVAVQEAAMAAAQSGWRIARVTLPGIDLRGLRQAAFLLTALAAHDAHGVAMADHPDGFSGQFHDVVRWARAQDAKKVAAAQAFVEQAGATLREGFAQCDAVLMPTTPSPAFAFAHGPGRDQAEFTVLANVSGLAAVAFPVGVDALGLPLSLQAVSASMGWSLAAARSLMVAAHCGGEG